MTFVLLTGFYCGVCQLYILYQTFMTYIEDEYRTNSVFYLFDLRNAGEFDSRAIPLP